jgi:1,4-dihydroxy-2-naphthoate polyprenyltransferase
MKGFFRYRHTTHASAPQETVARPGLRVWLTAARPRTWSAAVSPVIVGSAAAANDGHFRAGPATAAFFGALLIQIGTNFANDYSDGRRGVDSERIGPIRVTQAGLVTSRQIQYAIGVTFGLAVICGTYLVAIAGWPILLVGVLSIIAGLAYTGGPWPFGYHGLGDLFVFLFFGIAAVTGTYYVQAHRLTAISVVLAVPMGMLSMAILDVNNLRDADTDRRTGKWTLPARFGRGFGRVEYIAALAIAFAVPIALLSTHVANMPILLPLLTIPLTPPLFRLVNHASTPSEWNAALAGTSRLTIAYAILLAVGLAL